jgi:hypothetical protein
MKALSKQQAIAAALAAGATLQEIQDEAKIQKRSVGSTPHKNMIVALTLFGARNNKDDKIRLAAALVAKEMR